MSGQKKGYLFHRLKGFSNFHISELTAGFLNAATRNRYLETYEVDFVEKKASLP